MEKAGKTKATQKQAWFSLSLRHNPKAILPLYLAGLGSLCLQAFALFIGFSQSRSQDQTCEAVFLIGLGFLFLGLIGSGVYRHYRVAAFALMIALLTPPLCFLLWRSLFDGWTSASEYTDSPVKLWLYLQTPLVILTLWRSPWRRSVKFGATMLAACILVCFFIAHTRQEQHEVAAAPHVSGKYLSSLYEKNDTLAIQRLNHKRVVVTGELFGEGEGLFGGPPDKMADNIEFDGIIGGNSLTESQMVSIIGTCEGKDAYGMIHLSDCHVVK